MKLKVISLNLWWGGELMPQVIDFLDSENADVVALQESYNSHDKQLSPRYRSVDVLSAALNYEFTDFAQAFVHDGPAGLHPNGNAILSRYPINKSEATYITPNERKSYTDTAEFWPVLPRILQRVELSTPAGPVNVLNIHGVWDIDGDNYSEARKRMRDSILTEVEGKPNIIFTGDTNAKASNQAMVDLEQTLKSVFGQSITSTFNMERKDNPGYATAAVDLMYISPSIEILSSKVTEVDVSDHLPIVVELEIQSSLTTQT